MKQITKIITSLSALYEFHFISYSPNKEYLEMLWGTNTTNYDKNKYEIKLQKINSFTKGVIEKNNKFYYCPERLFIELEKFPLENTLKKEAIEKLEKVVNPFLVEKLYSDLKKMRRGLNKERIESYIARKSLNLKKLLQEYANDNKSIIREYIIVLLSNNEDLVTVLTKGGSAIEILSLTRRSTLDIDSHVGRDEINNIIKILKDKNNYIYFQIKDEEKIDYGKRIIKLHLIPKSRSNTITNLIIGDKEIEILLSLNTIYDKNELQNIIKKYSLQKRPLRRMKNYSVLTFSQEMILAEKFKTLISNPEITTRTKDLIDLYLLWDQDIDEKSFIKWFYKKSLTDRNSKTKEEMAKIIMENESKEFLKIKENFEEAAKMYELEINFNDCLEIYKKLISFFKKYQNKIE
ncbi:MAG: nucleotidyl transferase AbiEii/AbiGii toxin family protein [Metamycoplasmataceae bacterium]